MTEPSEWAMEKARLKLSSAHPQEDITHVFARALDEVATNAKAEEREACAKIAAEFGMPNRFSVPDVWRNEQSPSEVYDTAAQDVSFWIATAIRDRGGKND